MTTEPANPYGDLLVVDADTHIVEVGDLWTSRAPAALRDHVPHVEVIDDAPTWVMEGTPLGWAFKGTVIAADGDKEETVVAYTDWRGLDDIHEGAYSVDARLAVMDRAGIYAQIVFPNNVGLGGQSVAMATTDRALLNTCIEIYNDWSAELMEQSGWRMLPMAVMPAWNVDDCVREAKRAKGLGFRGVYLGGHLRTDDYAAILETADSFAPDDWQDFARDLQFDQAGEFYFFERDPDTGLSSTRVDATYLESRRRQKPALRVPLRYRVSRLAHDAVFAEEAPLHGVGRKLYSAVDQWPRPVGKALHVLEQAGKVALFGCRDCGDCSLPEIGYLCPESQCAKNQRNGPCGGTRQGLCEVGEKQCIWALAYERLKAYGEEESMLDGPVVTNDNALRGTSAWSNALLGRDHQARAARREASA